MFHDRAASHSVLVDLSYPSVVYVLHTSGKDSDSGSSLSVTVCFLVVSDIDKICGTKESYVN